MASRELFEKCSFFLSNNIPSTGDNLKEELKSIGFEVRSSVPFVIKKNSTTAGDIEKLLEVLHQACGSDSEVFEDAFEIIGTKQIDQNEQENDVYSKANNLCNTSINPRSETKQEMHAASGLSLDNCSNEDLHNNVMPGLDLVSSQKDVGQLNACSDKSPAKSYPTHHHLPHCDLPMTKEKHLHPKKSYANSNLFTGKGDYVSLDQKPQSESASTIDIANNLQGPTVSVQYVQRNVEQEDLIESEASFPTQENPSIGALVDIAGDGEILNSQAKHSIPAERITEVTCRGNLSSISCRMTPSPQAELTSTIEKCNLNSEVGVQKQTVTTGEKQMKISFKAKYQQQLGNDKECMTTNSGVSDQVAKQCPKEIVRVGEKQSIETQTETRRKTEKTDELEDEQVITGGGASRCPHKPSVFNTENNASSEMAHNLLATQANELDRVQTESASAALNQSVGKYQHGEVKKNTHSEPLNTTNGVRYLPYPVNKPDIYNEAIHRNTNRHRPQIANATDIGHQQDNLEARYCLPKEVASTTDKGHPSTGEGARHCSQQKDTEVSGERHLYISSKARRPRREDFIERPSNIIRGRFQTQMEDTSKADERHFGEGSEASHRPQMRDMGEANETHLNTGSGARHQAQLIGTSKADEGYFNTGSEARHRPKIMDAREADEGRFNTGGGVRHSQMEDTSGDDEKHFDADGEARLGTQMEDACEVDESDFSMGSGVRYHPQIRDMGEATETHFSAGSGARYSLQMESLSTASKGLFNADSRARRRTQMEAASKADERCFGTSQMEDTRGTSKADEGHANTGSGVRHYDERLFGADSDARHGTQMKDSSKGDERHFSMGSEARHHPQMRGTSKADEGHANTGSEVRHYDERLFGADSDARHGTQMKDSSKGDERHFSMGSEARHHPQMRGTSKADEGHANTGSGVRHYDERLFGADSDARHGTQMKDSSKGDERHFSMGSEARHHPQMRGTSKADEGHANTGSGVRHYDERLFGADSDARHGTQMKDSSKGDERHFSMGSEARHHPQMRGTSKADEGHANTGSGVRHYDERLFGADSDARHGTQMKDSSKGDERHFSMGSEARHHSQLRGTSKADEGHANTGSGVRHYDERLFGADSDARHGTQMKDSSKGDERHFSMGSEARHHPQMRGTSKADEGHANTGSGVRHYDERLFGADSDARHGTQMKDSSKGDERHFSMGSEARHHPQMRGTSKADEGHANTGSGVRHYDERLFGADSDARHGTQMKDSSKGDERHFSMGSEARHHPQMRGTSKADEGHANTGSGVRHYDERLFGADSDARHGTQMKDSSKGDERHFSMGSEARHHPQMRGTSKADEGHANTGSGVRHYDERLFGADSDARHGTQMKDSSKGDERHFSMGSEARHHPQMRGTSKADEGHANTGSGVRHYDERLFGADSDARHGTQMKDSSKGDERHFSMGSEARHHPQMRGTSKADEGHANTGSGVRHYDERLFGADSDARHGTQMKDSSKGDERHFSMGSEARHHPQMRGTSKADEGHVNTGSEVSHSDERLFGADSDARHGTQMEDSSKWDERHFSMGSEARHHAQMRGTSKDLNIRDETKYQTQSCQQEDTKIVEKRYLNSRAGHSLQTETKLYDEKHQKISGRHMDPSLMPRHRVQKEKAFHQDEGQGGHELEEKDMAEGNTKFRRIRIQIGCNPNDIMTELGFIALLPKRKNFSRVKLSMEEIDVCVISLEGELQEVTILAGEIKKILSYSGVSSIHTEERSDKVHQSLASIASVQGLLLHNAYPSNDSREISLFGENRKDRREGSTRLKADWVKKENSGSSVDHPTRLPPPDIITSRSFIQVTVTKADITSLDVDAIVNAANSRLRHGGGVAKAISQRAGPELQEECSKFTKGDRKVRVTEVFVSSGGKLPARHVIHAVGPKWEDYKDIKREECARDLRRTVLRCLLEAGLRNFRSIALPSISAAIFAVPIPICAEAYLQAVQTFDLFNELYLKSDLKEILFVDVVDDMVMKIEDKFKSQWSKELPESQVSNDFEFSIEHCQKTPQKGKFQDEGSGHFKTGSSFEPRLNSEAKPTPTPPPSSSKLNSPKITGYLYKLGNFMVTVSEEPALKEKRDLVVLIGDPFAQMHGSPAFNVKKELSRNQQYPHKKGTVEFLGGEKTCPLTIHVLMKSYDPSSLSEAFRNIWERETAFTKILPQVQSLVFTCSALYSSYHKNFDRKFVGDFTRNVYEYLRISRLHASISHHVRIAAGKDAQEFVHKVLESRQQKLNEAQAEGGAHKVSDTDSTKKECVVCLETDFIPYNLTCCKGNLCTTCGKKCQSCPFCRRPFTTITGDQPKGVMSIYHNRHVNLKGFEKHGSYEIKYVFPEGKQGENHPSPGRRYDKVERLAYLPANREGHQVLRLLRVAFLRRLTFTIGDSLTTGKKGVITWNDIHHKSSLKEGHQFGYPDPNYLTSVTAELANKGVTEKSLRRTEEADLAKVERSLQRIGMHIESVY